MAEYIDREALYEKAYWHGEHPDVGNPFPDGVDAIDIKDVDAIPAADVAPVTRCKDCANSYEDAFGRVCAYGICVDCTVPDDFYCASSKPKEKRYADNHD